MRLRFLLFVVIAALIPPALTFVVTGDVAIRAEELLEQRVTAGATALQARLDADSAKRRELLLRLVEQPEIRDLVREAARSDAKPSAAAVVKVREAVNQLFRKDVPELPELIAVVNQAGAQVVLHSGEPKDFPVESLAPAVAALSGQAAVTYALFDNAFYRLTAEPVGVSDGAVIVGDRIGDSSAVRLRDLIRADVSFVVGTKSVVSSLKDTVVRTHAAEASKHPSSARGSGEMDLKIPGSRFLKKVFPLLVPRDANRSLAKEIPGAFAVVTIRSELEWVGRAQAEGIAVGLFLLVIGLAWMRVVYGPALRQTRSIESHVARLRVDRTLRLTEKGFSSPFRELALEIDKLADEWSKEAPAFSPLNREPATPPAPTADVSKPVIQRPPVELPLASTPTPPPPDLGDSAHSFPFQDDPHVKTGKNKITREATPASTETVPQVPKTAGPSTLPPGPAVSGIIAPETRSEPRPRLTATAPAPISGPDETQAGPIPLPGAAAPRNTLGLQKPVIAAQKPLSAGDPELPPDLLARSQELERELLEGGAESDPDEEHYKSVFDEFLTVRRRCGEANDGLTFEKFASRLKKNRDQLIEKYSCRSVRFQVYVKEGKAAVKAVPVR
jgi:hypothetical protein